MAEIACVLRCRRSISLAGKLNGAFVAFLTRRLYSSESAASYRDEAIYNANANDRWLALPPFAPSLDASAVGKALAGRAPEQYADPTTALKWVRRCCPHLPMSLVQKLFRLRQVRKDVSSSTMHAVANQIRRVAAKDAMMSGEVILLPATVQKNVTRKFDSSHNEVETDFIRSLELYKDTAIIAINKPPGMAVQGGVRIKHSIDMIAARCLRYDFPESPRLVHRLDRDSSGVLVLARTQECACLLHSLFREKTSGALTDVDRALQRKYLALVIGIPRHTKGTISAPLTKIVLGDGTSERITIANDKKCVSSQHALTEYKVISSSVHGYTWLELWPLTGRKHQLRVHCAEVLGTPIVGDYKYGRVAHRKWEPIQPSEPVLLGYKGTKQNLPFGLELDGGSICDKSPHLHLHCKQMVLPDVSLSLQKMQSPSMDSDFSKVDKLNLVAPLPSHMQMSWDVLNSLS